MPPSRTETWVVKLVGGPEDGAEVRMNDMFCDIKFPVPGMPTVIEYSDKPKHFIHLYKRVSTYRAEYVGYEQF